MRKVALTRSSFVKDLADSSIITVLDIEDDFESDFASTDEEVGLDDEEAEERALIREERAEKRVSLLAGPSSLRSDC